MKKPDEIYFDECPSDVLEYIWALEEKVLRLQSEIKMVEDSYEEILEHVKTVYIAIMIHNDYYETSYVLGVYVTSEEAIQCAKNEMEIYGDAVASFKIEAHIL